MGNDLELGIVIVRRWAVVALCWGVSAACIGVVYSHSAPSTLLTLIFEAGALIVFGYGMWFATNYNHERLTARKMLGWFAAALLVMSSRTIAKWVESHVGLRIPHEAISAPAALFLAGVFSNRQRFKLSTDSTDKPRFRFAEDGIATRWPVRTDYRWSQIEIVADSDDALVVLLEQTPTTIRKNPPSDESGLNRQIADAILTRCLWRHGYVEAHLGTSFARELDGEPRGDRLVRCLEKMCVRLDLPAVGAIALADIDALANPAVVKFVADDRRLRKRLAVAAAYGWVLFTAGMVCACVLGGLATWQTDHSGPALPLAGSVIVAAICIATTIAVRKNVIVEAMRSVQS